MDIFNILLIAISLAMDAFAVSIAHGTTIGRVKVINGLRIALSFGLFQAIMPILGWIAGLSFRETISGFDHWIAFGLLLFIGTKMIYQSIRAENNEEQQKGIDISTLVVLSIATSIDALAVGLSFSLLQVSIFNPVIVIGIVTFALSFIGFFFGNRIGRFFGKNIGIIGGVILILIGIKIVLEHMV